MSEPAASNYVKLLELAEEKLSQAERSLNAMADQKAEIEKERSHPMTEQKCANCRFFIIRVSHSNPDLVGSCHRYPPALKVDPEASAFPWVYDADWCGEWRKKESQRHD